MSEELEVSAGPAGVTGKFRGEQTLQILMAILLGAWVWYLINNAEVKAAERERMQMAATDKLVDAVKDQTKVIQKQDETQKTMIYVLTLPQAKRERLGLVEPDQLRRMRGYDR